MFEYIKRVSIAISFIAHRIDEQGHKVKDILESISFDLLLIAQKFRTEEYRVEDLKVLESKIAYLVDVVDFARMNVYISNMNAKVFVDSQLAFLKHIINLIDQKNSLSLPIYHLKQLDEVFSRKSAKENLQNKFTDKTPGFEKYNFSDSVLTVSDTTLNYADLKVSIPETPIKPTEKHVEKVVENPVPAKKILEESLLSEPLEDVEVTSVEKEIGARRARILKILSTGGGSIKDISVKMRDVNEKTIQRDLLELMRERKVIMLGKKRWAKYYLK